MSAAIVDILPSKSPKQIQLDKFLKGQRYSGVLRRTANINPDLTFALDDIPTGDYNLYLSSRTERPRLLSKQSVSVDADLNSLIVTPMQRATVTVAVQKNDEIAGPVGKVGVRLSPSSEGDTSYGQSVGPDGQAVFEPIEPGQYLVQVFPSRPDLCVRSVAAGREEILNKYVDLDSQSGTQIIAELRTCNGSITGSVKEKGSMVVLVPQPTSPDGVNVKTQPVQQDGTFAFDNLPPGKYSVLASQEARSPVWSQPAFLETLDDVAQHLSLGENEHKDVSLTCLDSKLLSHRASTVNFYLP